MIYIFTCEDCGEEFVPNEQADESSQGFAAVLLRHLDDCGPGGAFHVGVEGEG
jgi:hypothetical protein